MKTLTIILAVLAGSTHAQSNFVFTPEKPKPGDIIQITYTPAGNIANTLKPVEAIAHVIGVDSEDFEDLALRKTGKSYTATISTDTAVRLIRVAFHVNNKFDNNFGEGYAIQLYQNDKPVSKSSGLLAGIYQFGDEDFGIDQNRAKAVELYEQEFRNYPNNRRQYLVFYYRAFNVINKEGVSEKVLWEIETILKDGLVTEDDYSLLEGLYAQGNYPEQSKFIELVKKEKFPQGAWHARQKIEKFFSESGFSKRIALVAEMERDVEINPNWKQYASDIVRFKATAVLDLLNEKQFEKLQREIAALPDPETRARTYNTAAWRMQIKNERPDLAQAFSKLAVDWAQKEQTSPTTKKPDYLTSRQWEKQRSSRYRDYADTYAMTLYRSGEYKQGFELATKLAITENKGKSTDKNNTYALFAEKVLRPEQALNQVADFVRNGKASDETVRVLRRLYVATGKSEVDYDGYLNALLNESRLKSIEKLKKSMVREPVAPFTIRDMYGNKVESSDWKGKVVVIDFWATWCGPCIASFPGMQEAVNKFKDHPDVKFVFIDTWEQGADKEKRVMKFITSNRYTFDVLMDNDNKVVEQFKVQAIPAKFVLDKEGNICFKATGYFSDNDKLVEELNDMIALAAGKAPE